MRPRFISPMERKIEELRIDPPAPNIDLSFVFSLNSSDFCGNCVALKSIFVFLPKSENSFFSIFLKKKNLRWKSSSSPQKNFCFLPQEEPIFYLFFLCFCFPLVFFYRFNSFLCSVALIFSLFSIELFFFFNYFFILIFLHLFFLSFFLLPL